MPIRIITGKGGFLQMKASFKKNWLHYLQEALGLAIFMISACYFSAQLFSPQSSWYHFFESNVHRNIVMGVLMGNTALFIFYAPFTAPSGSQINPAVTIAFYRLGKMCPWDVLFYILFQVIGGTAAVYMMRWIMGSVLISPPVNSAVTVPFDNEVYAAVLTEFAIAFITMSMVLFTTKHKILSKYTRVIAGCFVCCWVILAGPVSGFGMNPARSFASALPSGIWTSFWIYVIIPFAGMLSAAEAYNFIQSKNEQSTV